MANPFAWKCNVCGRGMDWDAPSGVCSEACLRKGQNMPRKTREDVDRLKRDWLRDGNWDIYNTAGFEDHREELKQFQDDHEARRKEEQDKVSARMARIGCKPAFPTMGYSSGMTLREYYIGQALAGTCASLAGEGDVLHDTLAIVAITNANAVLRKLAEDELKQEEGAK